MALAAVAHAAFAARSRCNAGLADSHHGSSCGNLFGFHYSKTHSNRRRAPERSSRRAINRNGTDLLSTTQASASMPYYHNLQIEMPQNGCTHPKWCMDTTHPAPPSSVRNSLTAMTPRNAATPRGGSCGVAVHSVCGGPPRLLRGETLASDLGEESNARVGQTPRPMCVGSSAIPHKSERVITSVIFHLTPLRVRRIGHFVWPGAGRSYARQRAEPELRRVRA